MKRFACLDRRNSSPDGTASTKTTAAVTMWRSTSQALERGPPPRKSPGLDLTDSCAEFSSIPGEAK
jgi:hypothetical protein